MVKQYPADNSTPKTSPSGTVIKAPITSVLSKNDCREILRLIKHLTEDIVRNGTVLIVPPSWLLNALVEQSGITHYDSRDWLHSTLLLTGLIEEKLTLEKQGQPQFFDQKKSSIFPNSEGIECCDALGYIRILKKHIGKIEDELNGDHSY